MCIIAKAKRWGSRQYSTLVLFSDDHFDRARDFGKLFGIETSDEAVLSGEFRHQINFNGQSLSRRQIWIVSEIGASQSWSFESHFALRQLHFEDVDESEDDLQWLSHFFRPGNLQFVENISFENKSIARSSARHWKPLDKIVWSECSP